MDGSMRDAEDSPAKPRRRMALHWKILIGLVIGAMLGIAAHAAFARPIAAGAVDSLDLDANGVHDGLDWAVTRVVEPLGRVFLRLILMVVLPLVFSALALSVVELGDLRRIGRIGIRTFGYTAVLSATAVMVGVLFVNAIRPGERLSPEKRDGLAKQYAKEAEAGVEKARRAKSLPETLLDIIPENPLQEMVGAIDGSSKGNGMLAVMFCALLVGAAAGFVGQRAETLVKLLDGLFAVSMAIIDVAMRVAPYGVACLVFSLTARLGGELLATLAWFVGTALAGFAVQLLVVYPVLLVAFARRKPWAFFRDVSDAMMTAFATSSSNATLPTSLHVADEKLRLPQPISRFVLTVGATANQNGTALYEGVVVLFLAQVLGVDLTLAQQVMVVLMAVLGGIGTAGVPGGSIPMVILILQSVGVPGESIALILGIDRFLDMCRTTLNVTGDLAVAACVGRAEAR